MPQTFTPQESYQRSSELISDPGLRAVLTTLLVQIERRKIKLPALEDLHRLECELAKLCHASADDPTMMHPAAHESLCVIGHGLIRLSALLVLQEQT